jgi:hypothetical protein
LGNFAPTQLSLAQRKVALRQRNLVWRNAGFFGATSDNFAPSQPSMAQRKIPWRNVTFFDAK